MSSNVPNRLKFGKISRKDLLCRKFRKMDIENLIVGVLNLLFQRISCCCGGWNILVLFDGVATR